jgi:hypothetical protein
MSSNTLLNKLDAVYHSAICFVTKAPYTTHHCDLYTLIGWPSLHTRSQTHWLQVIYKILLGKVPPYLSSLVTIAAPTCSTRPSRYLSLVTPKTTSLHPVLCCQWLERTTKISETGIRAAHRLLHLYIAHLLFSPKNYLFPYCIYLFCSFAPHYLYLYFAHSSTANQPFQCFTCYIVFTSPPWPFLAFTSLNSPHLLT